jgi:hypothetical protein
LLRDKANYDVVEGFLNEFTGHLFKITDVLVNETNNKNRRNESEKVDILVEDDKGELILVEIQFIFSLEYFYRKLFGVSKTIVEQMVQSEQYPKIQKIYSIYTVYFDFGKGEDYVYTGKTVFEGLHNHDILDLPQNHRKIISEIEAGDLSPEYYFIKVDKFNDVITDMLDEWIYYLKHNQVKEEFKAKGLLKLSKVLDYDCLSREDKNDFDHTIDERRDDNSFAYTARMKKGEQYETLFDELVIASKGMNDAGREARIADDDKDNALETYKKLNEELKVAYDELRKADEKAYKIKEAANKAYETYKEKHKIFVEKYDIFAEKRRALIDANYVYSEKIEALEKQKLNS